MNRLIIAMLCISSIAFGQETDARVRPGLQVSSVFSGIDHGISPALTLNFRRSMLSVGPRFSYDRMSMEKSPVIKHDRQLIMDASFRYYLMPEWKKVRPFAQVGTEYKYTSVAYDQVYWSSMSYPYGPIFLYDLNGRWDNKKHYISIYAGVGVDVPLWKKLSAFASVGAGTAFSMAESELSNRDTGKIEYSAKNQRNEGFSWIASAGLGYRF